LRPGRNTSPQGKTSSKCGGTGHREKKEPSLIKPKEKKKEEDSPQKKTEEDNIYYAKKGGRAGMKGK